MKFIKNPKITKQTLKELRGKLLAKEDELDQKIDSNSREETKNANGDALNDFEESKEIERRNLYVESSIKSKDL